MHKLPVSCVLFFFSMLMCEVMALKEGDTGVCVTKISSRRTKRVSFTRYTSKWCGPRKCIARSYKTQGYTVTSKQLVCCSGFEYREDGEYCAPHCSMKCSGTCVAPDTCRCDPPAYLHPEYNTCVTPTCDPPCYNGQCVANNVCQCNERYQVYNASTCVSICEPGFVHDENFACVPRCDPDCVNGHCVAPNLCSCYEGYILKKDVCEPKCDDCVNGQCVAPNTCACAEGYFSINNTYCAPKCDNCDKGVCTAPNVCTCLEGYISQEHVCIPKCNKCVNGNCIAPNTCACLDGYSPMNDTHCAPKCDKCINGACTAPNVCTCSEGYYFEDYVCLAKCDNCIHGKCVAPNVCLCFDGYDLVKETCVPTSKCQVGYSYVDGSCRPVCDVPCENGQCLEPNVCACHEGYTKDQDSGNCLESIPGRCYVSIPMN